MLQTGSRSENTTDKTGTIPLIPGDMTGIDTDGMIVTGPVHLGYRRILADPEPPHQPIRYRQLAEGLEGTITGGIDTNDTGKGTVLGVYDLTNETSPSRTLWPAFSLRRHAALLVGRLNMR